MQQIIISLISGLVGGNAAGALMKKLSLGPIGNSIVGLLGGGLGGHLLSLVTGSNADAGSIIGNIASSAVGGSALMAIVGFVKSKLVNN
jgi:uncharacterized membrane protein YeaQ/YmgE (transglycosylase-associated protein family)